MNANTDRANEVSNRIIGATLTVANALGAGFAEKVYENALAHELRQAGLAVAQQRGISVFYNGVTVGEYTTDLLVEDCVIVELKTVADLDNVHRAQCLNYLKATGLHLCLLLNFGKPSLQMKRIVQNF